MKVKKYHINYIIFRLPKGPTLIRCTLPTQFKKGDPPNTIHNYKFLNCHLYDTCLTFCAKHEYKPRWPWFSCQACPMNPMAIGLPDQPQIEPYVYHAPIPESEKQKVGRKKKVVVEAPKKKKTAKKKKPAKRIIDPAKDNRTLMDKVVGLFKV